MKLRVKAAAITAGGIVSAVVAAELLRAGVNFLTTEELTNLITAVCVGFMIYSVYRLILGNLEYNQSIKKMQQEYKARQVDQ